MITKKKKKIKKKRFVSPIGKLFSKNFKLIIKREGKRHRDIVQICGFTKTTVSRWAHGLNVPRKDSLKKLAMLLNASEQDFFA